MQLCMPEDARGCLCGEGWEQLLQIGAGGRVWLYGDVNPCAVGARTRVRVSSGRV